MSGGCSLYGDFLLLLLLLVVYFILFFQIIQLVHILFFIFQSLDLLFFLVFYLVQQFLHPVQIQHIFSVAIPDHIHDLFLLTEFLLQLLVYFERGHQLLRLTHWHHSLFSGMGLDYFLSGHDLRSEFRRLLVFELGFLLLTLLLIDGIPLMHVHIHQFLFVYLF